MVVAHVISDSLSSNIWTLDTGLRTWDLGSPILVVVTLTHIARARMISIMLASIPSRLEHTFDHINQIPDTDSNTISPRNIYKIWGV